MTAFLEELEEILGPVETQGYAEARLALDIAVQFAALRERRGLTQRQVAERLGKSQQAISKIENPSHGGHNLARLKEAVAALDATIDVTIVPLEDLAAYEACRAPKPTLEDLDCRLAWKRSMAVRPRSGRFARRRRNQIKVSRRLRASKRGKSGGPTSGLVTIGGVGNG